MNDYSKIIKLWTTYGFDYEYNFIRKAFASRGELMVKHLEIKFQEAYNIAGMYGAFFYFWTMLDSGNKQLLENYVMDNFKG